MISRRQFFRLAPASVGAIALGVAVLPKPDTRILAFEADGRPLLDQMTKTMLTASVKMAHPPLAISGEEAKVYFYPTSSVWIDGRQ